MEIEVPFVPSPTVRELMDRNQEIARLRAALELIADTDPDEGTAWFHDVAHAALKHNT